jgi:hypothetical protein
MRVPFNPNGLNRESISATNSAPKIDFFNCSGFISLLTIGFFDLCAAISRGASIKSLLQPTTNCPANIAIATLSELINEYCERANRKVMVVTITVGPK